MEIATFRLSRVYAEGWNKARLLSANETAALSIRDLVALNPYGAEPERSRWMEGFAKAIGS